MPREITWPLVGRDDELAIVAETLGDDAGRGLVIAGAAGVGKTRLAREALRLGRSQSLRGVAVSGSRSAATIPLGAFATVLPPGPSASVFEGLHWATEALTDEARDGRLVLVVDDAHLLDPASATLVHQVASRTRVTVVATVRTDESSPDAVTALWKDDLAQRLELQLLSHDEIVGLLNQALSGDVGAATAHQLWTESAGSPLYLRELVSAALDAGALVEEGGVWTLKRQPPIPTSIQELVAQRLDGIEAIQRRALVTLAFADVLELAVLQHLHPDADIETLQRRELIEVNSDGAHRQVALAHPMYGEVLRARAPDTTAVTVARRLITATEQLGGPRPEDVLRLATWHLLAGVTADPELVASAAGQAYHAGDFDLAERLARAALAVEESPTMVLLLARLLDERGEHEASEARFASIETAALDSDLHKRVALARTDNLFFGLGRKDLASAVVVEATAELPDDQTGELLANRAWMEVHAGRPDRALGLLAEIDSRDTRGQVEAGIVRAWARALLGDIGGALQAADDARTLDQPATSPTVRRSEGFPEWAKGVALLLGGRLDDAARIARSGRAAALATQPAFLHTRWTSLLASVRMEQGRIESAISLFRQAAAMQLQLDQSGLLSGNLAGQAMATAQAGAGDRATALLDEIDGLGPVAEHLYEVDVLSARAWTAAAHGHRSAAVRLLEQSASAARTGSMVPLEARARHDIVRLRPDRDQATRLAELAAATDSAAVKARATHAAAVVDGDPQHLERAASRLDDLGMCLHAAEAFTAAGSSHAGDGRRNASACRRRAADLRQQCPSAATPGLQPLDHVDPLTPREREVVTMAAGDQSSRAIADQLVISIRTVNNHLQRAYVKLGVHSRGEAAEALDIDRHR